MYFFYNTLFYIFKKSFWRLIFCMLFLLKYALINLRSPNQYTISIDLLPSRIRISKQCKHRNKQAHWCIFYNTSFYIFKKSFWKLIFCTLLFLKYALINFRKLIFCMLFFLKYALINFWSPNHYTISIDLLPSRIRISKQCKHRDQQAKG